MCFLFSTFWSYSFVFPEETWLLGAGGGVGLGGPSVKTKSSQAKYTLHK